MKSDCSAESWLKFFTSAGIPMESSRTYAVTFSKNEIQLDMLSEIKKEYLVDMGITLMGHIIAILRHAKTVYEENVTKTTLSPTAARSGQAVPKAVPKEKPVLKTMPLRISGNDKDEQNAAPTSTVQKTTTATVDSRQRAIGTSTIQNNIVYGPQMKTSNLQFSEKELATKKKDSEVLQIKAKIPSSVVVNNVARKKIAELPVSKIDEGNINRGKVFERLGVEVTYDNLDSSESSNSSESVFSRLGGKTSPSYSNSPNSSPVKVTSSSSSSSSYKLTAASNGEDYSHIKKALHNGNKPKVKSVLCTMRADEAEAQTAAARRGSKRTRSPSPDGKRFRSKESDIKKSIKSRLGRVDSSLPRSNSRVRCSSVDRSIALREFGEVSSEKDVRTRLGHATFDRSEERAGILSKRISPIESIGLSGLNKTITGIKSRLGQTNSMLKSSTSSKKVSFGPVSQQLIPLEAKPVYRMRFPGRLRFTDDYYANYNGTINIGTGSRLFTRLGY